MAAKQGGKGKQSSQSDRNYWARIQNRPGKVSARKAKNRKASGEKIPDYGRKPMKARVIERVAFTAPLDKRARQDGRELSLVVCAGVLLDILPRETDAAIVAGSILPGLAWQHLRLNPLTGKTRLVAWRKFR